MCRHMFALVWAFGFGGGHWGWCEEQKPAAEIAANWAYNLPQDSGRFEALNGIISGWAHEDPEAAAKWFGRLENGNSDWVMQSLVRGWAAKNPQAVAAWIKSLPENESRKNAYNCLGQNWRSMDKNELLKWSEALAVPEERESFVGGLAFSTVMNEPEPGIQWVQNLPDEKLRLAALREGLRAWGFRDRAAAEKWVAALPEGEMKKASSEGLKNRIIRRRLAGASAAARKKVVLNFETPEELKQLMEAPVSLAREDAITQYVLKWFEQDKDKATQWVAAKLQGWVLAKTAGAVARKWSQSDPVKAAEWVWQVPPLWQDFLSSLGCEWATDMPDKIAPLVLKWREGARRQVILRGVCNAWGQKDPVAALAWTDSLPPGDTRKYARKGLVVGWTCKDDAGCLDWINQLTDASEKKEAQHYRMHGLARIRPQEALKEMESLATDPSEPPTYCVGKEWVLANPQAAADWAKSLPESSAKERALEAVLRQWVYSDAVKTADWSAKLPEQQSRDAALGAVMEKWVEQSPRQALSWAEGQKDTAIKLGALKGLLRAWISVDPVESKNWFTQMPAGKEKEVLQEEVMLNRDEQISAGEMAPEFSAKTLEGKAFKLSDYRGKHVLLDFWATWCGPCRGETPNLKAVHEKYGKREDFVMIGLSLDKDVDKPLAYAKENGCAWVDGFLGDWGKDTVTKKYGVHGIPSIFLIGPDGKVVAEGLRGEGIMQAVSAALDTKK